MLAKLNSGSQLKIGAILNYAIIVLNTVVGLLYTPYMLRMMGQSEYGLYLNWEEQGDRTILDVPHKKEDINVSESLFVQDRFNYGVEDKVQAIEYCLENSMSNDSTFYLKFHVHEW